MQPAATALVVVTILAAIGFALSYRRHFLLIAERREGPANSGRNGNKLYTPSYRFSRLWIDSGVERACYQFVYTTLRRNESHLLLLSIWFGFGLLLTAHSLQSFPHISAQAWLAIPLQLSFFLLSGLRQIFDLPAAIQANWIFRMNLNTGAKLVDGLCRKIMLACVFSWLLPLYLPLVVLNLGWQGAVICLLVDLPLILVAIELLMRDYRNFPFATAVHPSHNRIMISVIGAVGIILVVVPTLAILQAYALTRPGLLTVLIVLSCGAFAAVSATKRDKPDAMVEFEGANESLLAQLHLSGD